MKDTGTIKITEGSSHSSDENEPLDRKPKWEKLKKSIIYFLMFIACMGCFYLIFKPKEDKKVIEEAGLNTEVPQAADDKLQSDKQKAYELDLLEQKNEEKRNAMTSLSDYWSESNGSNQLTTLSPESYNNAQAPQTADQNALNSYRNAQQTLGSFYSRDEHEVTQLKREINRLKNEISQKDAVPSAGEINDQLELMEKSYQMAAKYLPAPKQQEEPELKKTSEAKPEENKIKITAVHLQKRNVVSSLYREPSDSTFLASISHNRFSGLQNEQENTVSQNHSSIHAVIHETMTLVNESIVPLRLTQGLLLGKITVPSGTVLKAAGKLQGGRLLLKILSIEYKGIITPVEINIHDNDGQLGLYIPYSSEQTAINDIASNMSQNSGTNIMMTQSAGQQVAADLTRGLVQGVSGYFQKKVRQPKVTVKAGHQVLLVSKNN
ncbi:conjugative transposon protein TraM [Chryseobacterium culicis]|uniref:Bacteroides conjugative transposon TraM protein n=1 Tax=Chryseobacterium culicis TaxID=680127 RepID=A0A1H6IGS2_CHRCI|nr:conjugative transposon protein TraM [Chryseobacterium culicis]SEH47993.1 Bacteroides conjugative transposon TraM protein [Chryseobacterium culicis]